MHRRREHTSPGTTSVAFIETRSLISFSFHEVFGVADRLIDVGPLVDLGALVELQRVLRRRSRRQHLRRFCGLPDMMQNALDHGWFLDEGDDTHRTAAAWTDQRQAFVDAYEQ